MGLSPAGAERFSFDSSTAAEAASPADDEAPATAAPALAAESPVAFRPEEEEDDDDEFNANAAESAAEAASSELACNFRPEVCAAVARSMSASVAAEVAVV